MLVFLQMFLNILYYSACIHAVHFSACKAMPGEFDEQWGTEVSYWKTECRNPSAIVPLPTLLGAEDTV